MDTINIGIIMDNFFQLTYFKEFLEGFQECRVLFTCRSIDEFNKLPSLYYDLQVMLLDIRQTEEDGLHGIDAVKRIYPNVKIIILSTYEKRTYLFESFRKGASGYLIKSAKLSEIFQGVRNVVEYKVALSPCLVPYLLNFILEDSLSNPLREKLSKREYEILSNVKDGASTKEIAKKLYITAATVNFHLQSIYAKLNVSSKAELLVKVFSNKTGINNV